MFSLAWGFMFSLVGFHVFPSNNVLVTLLQCVSAPHGGLGHRQYDALHAVVYVLHAFWVW